MIFQTVQELKRVNLLQTVTRIQAQHFVVAKFSLRGGDDRLRIQPNIGLGAQRKLNRLGWLFSLLCNQAWQSPDQCLYYLH